MTRLGIRMTVAACLLVASGPLAAQRQAVSQADSALVARILMAEQRGDRGDAALTIGAAHATRIRNAGVASGSTNRVHVAARDSMPRCQPPGTLPEPDGSRVRALHTRGNVAHFRAEPPIVPDMRPARRHWYRPMRSEK